MNIINGVGIKNFSSSASAAQSSLNGGSGKRKADGSPDQPEADLPPNPNAMQIDVPASLIRSISDLVSSSTSTEVGSSAKKQKTTSPVDIVETKVQKIQRIHEELKDLWQARMNVVQAETLKAIPRSFQSLHLGFDQFPTFSNVYTLAEKIEEAALIALVRYEGKDKLEAVIVERNKELKSLLLKLTPARKDHHKAGMELLLSAIHFERYDLIKDLLKQFDISNDTSNNLKCMEVASKTSSATVRLLLANGVKIHGNGKELQQNLLKMAHALNDPELLLALCKEKFIIDVDLLKLIRKFPNPLLNIILANADFSLVPKWWIYHWFEDCCLNHEEIDTLRAIGTKFTAIIQSEMKFSLFLTCTHRKNYIKLRYLISIGCKDKNGEAFIRAVETGDRELVDIIKPVSNVDEALIFYLEQCDINQFLEKQKHILDILLESGASLRCKSSPSLLVSFVERIATRKGVGLNCQWLRWFIENGAEVGNVPPQSPFWPFIVSHSNAEVFSIMKPQFAKVPQQEQVKILNKALMDLFKVNFDLTDVRRIVERGARNIGEAYYELQDHIALDEKKAEQLDGEKKNGREPRKNSKLYKKIQESTEAAEDNIKIKKFLFRHLKKKTGVDDHVDFPKGSGFSFRISLVPTNEIPVKTPLLLAYYALNYEEDFNFFLSCGANPSLTDSRGFGLFTYGLIKYLQSTEEELEDKELVNIFNEILKIFQSRPSSSICPSDLVAFILISRSISRSFRMEGLPIKANISLPLLLKTYDLLSQIDGIKPLLGPREVLVERLVKVNYKHFEYSLKLRSFTESQMKEIQEIDPIEELVKMSTAINFNGRMLPYMAQQRRMTAEELTGHFFILVDRLKNETPMLGTPPAADTVKVKKFYQELKEKVAILAYSCRNSTGKYDEDKVFALVCNLAESAKACGAGWAGEIQEMYFSYMTEGETLALAGKIYAALAKRRKKIVHDWAKKETAQNPGGEAHYYLAILEYHGCKLGIPGAEKVTEHLAKITPEIITSFNSYWGPKTNVKALIDWMYALIAENKDPIIKREAILDWMKDNLIGEWRLQDFKVKVEKMRSKLSEFISTKGNTPLDKIESEFLQLLREAATTPDVEPQIILTDYMNSIERLLKENGTLQEKLNSIMEILVNAAEATRKSEFLTTLHNEDYSIKRFAVIQMLEKLKIIHVRTNLLV